MIDFLAMMCGMLVSYVVLTAERNRREARPNGKALVLAGHATMSAAATLSVLLLAWVVLFTLGVAPEPTIE